MVVNRTCVLKMLETIFCLISQILEKNQGHYDMIQTTKLTVEKFLGNPHILSVVNKTHEMSLTHHK